MSIQFEVIDINCQAADNSFFVPQVQLVGKSTTIFATLYGYNEFGTPSSPPKKYRTITWNGTSERVGFTAESTPRQCAGAQYVFSGIGQVDMKGHQVSSYSKKFFAQCSKQFWPFEPLQLNDFAVSTGGVSPQFVGFCWDQVPESCATCDPDSTNWAFLGEKSTNTPSLDVAAFMHAPSDPVVTSTSFSITNKTFNAFTAISTEAFSGVLFGTDSDNYNIVVGTDVRIGRPVITDPSTLNFPAQGIKDSSGTFIIQQFIVFADTNNYSAVLTDEYTDADALANAAIVQGNGKTAQNLPRTTGFTSVTTNVIFNLNCSNLISGQDYLVTVDLWNQNTNTHTTKSYGFTATASTHVITDTIHTPPAGQSISVQTPKIAFVT